MKVTVTDNFLNVRSGAPSVNAPANVYLSPGDVVEVEDNLYKGDSYDGVNTWYKEKGTTNYYWSGGGSQDTTPGIILYNTFLKQFDQQILQTQGDKTTIMVIDEGIVLNPAYFDLNKMQAVNIDTGEIKTDHGNFIGGILAGKSAVLGIVPKAKIVSLKYTSNTTPPNQFLQNLITALQHVVTNPGPTIVNLSQSFNKFTMAGNDMQKTGITNTLQQIAALPNKFVICAAGDNLAINNSLFPSNLTQCLSVGSFDQQNSSISLPATLNIISPIVNFRSFDLNFQITNEIGSSFSTAIIAALASCIVSSRLPAVTKTSELLSELKKYHTDHSQFQFGDLATFQYQVT